MPVLNRIADLAPAMAEWRRHLHAHPELNFACHETAAFVAEKLRAFGVDEIHEGIATTGIVAIIEGQGEGPTIGLRADMDALPIQEANTFEHRSKHDGRMHACGHDGHTAMLLGAAAHLAATRNFDGQVFFIFQPAEEGIGGARAMIEDGLFEQFPCDSIFGMHNRPTLPIGEFAVRSGAMMAGGAFFDIDIEGKGSHGARPEVGIDPVVVAAQMVCALQTVVARNLRPIDTAVLSVTQIHAGDAYNVIPQRARISGTVRAFSSQVMDEVESAMTRIAHGTASTFGASASVDFRRLFAPTVNDAEQAEFAAGICVELVGADKVRRNPPLIMASEDFSFMLERVPGCYINIGNGDGEGACEVHNPGYDFNDEALAFGASFFVRAVETRLARD